MFAMLTVGVLGADGADYINFSFLVGAFHRRAANGPASSMPTRGNCGIRVDIQ